MIDFVLNQQFMQMAPWHIRYVNALNIGRKGLTGNLLYLDWCTQVQCLQVQTDIVQDNLTIESCLFVIVISLHLGSINIKYMFACSIPIYAEWKRYIQKRNVYHIVHICIVQTTLTYLMVCYQGTLAMLRFQDSQHQRAFINIKAYPTSLESPTVSIYRWHVLGKGTGYSTAFSSLLQSCWCDITPAWRRPVRCVHSMYEYV